MRKTALLLAFVAAAAFGQPNVIRHPPVYTYATAPTCSAGESKFYALSDSGACDSDDASSGVICQCVDGTVSEVGAGGGAASDSFKTINAPSGTDPVAESSTDTLNITCAGGLSCTGDATTDTLDFTMGTASLATALAANGANCSAGQFPLGVDASGAVESCSTDISGNAATATTATSASALAANGANCSAGQYPLGVDASGAVESCTADDTGTDDQTATEVNYTPTTGTDWVDPDPTTVGGGLDDLAGRLTVEEAKADDDVPESGDFGAATDLDADGSVSADSVALGTDTTGNYVSSATVSQGLTLIGTEGASLGLQDCAATEVLKRNAGDTAWECAADATGSGIGGSTGATDNAMLAADGTGGATAQARDVTVSDVSGGVVTIATTAGNALAIANTDPPATTGASVAGDPLTITAGNAVASTDTAGAAAGGTVTITAGNAARLTSGNANGGSIYLAPGAPVGTGAYGEVRIGPPGGGGEISSDHNLSLSATQQIYITAKTSKRLQLGANATANLVDLYSNGFGMDPTLQYAWDSTANGFTRDTGLARSAAGVVSTTDGGSGIGAFLTARSVEASTAGSGAPNVLLATESWKVLTNEGATAANYHTLPTAVAGYVFTFVVQDADGLRVTASTGDTIRIAATVSSSGGYCESTTIGDSITLIAINATEYVATSVVGSGWSCAFLFIFPVGLRRRLRMLATSNDNEEAKRWAA